MLNIKNITLIELKDGTVFIKNSSVRSNPNRFYIYLKGRYHHGEDIRKITPDDIVKEKTAEAILWNIAANSVKKIHTIFDEEKYK